MRPETVMTRLMATIVMWAAVSAAAPQRAIPAGTPLDLLLQTPLNSSLVRVDQRFEAATIKDVSIQGQVALAAGATVRGFVSSVRAVPGFARQAHLTLSFEEVRPGDRPLRLRGTVVAVLDPKSPADLRRPETGPIAGGAPGPA